ncbi:hypothetical protein C7401_11960 [Paraburkholderia unamae]|nr:hypothetical protein [Paraburkholderia unamae]RAR56411.1 hypothetical protein C7401_11960 [Paraburkholderia unamae]
MTGAPISNNEEEKYRLPRELEGLVLTAGQILKALGEQEYAYEVDKVFVRAVDDPRYVGMSPFRAHRFGPPLELVGDNGKLPFTWVYLGMDSLVAAWESQLVLNNRGAGTGFHVTRKVHASPIKAPALFRPSASNSSRLCGISKRGATWLRSQFEALVRARLANQAQSRTRYIIEWAGQLAEDSRERTSHRQHSSPPEPREESDLIAGPLRTG